jgi:hypothetical protein
MSDTKTPAPLPPLVSDMELRKASWKSTSVTAAARELTTIRDFYEADRQRTREVVQILMGALQAIMEAHGPGTLATEDIYEASVTSLNLAKSQLNIEPTKP